MIMAHSRLTKTFGKLQRVLDSVSGFIQAVGFKSLESSVRLVQNYNLCSISYAYLPDLAKCIDSPVTVEPIIKPIASQIRRQKSDHFPFLD